MNGKICAFAMTLFGLLMLFLVGTSLNSCDHRSRYEDQQDADSVYFIHMLKKTLTAVDVEPTFVSATQVLQEQQNRANSYSQDSMFRAIPQDVLSNVCVTLLRVKSSITVGDIVTEYKNYRKVYDNLDLKRAAEEVAKFKENSANVPVVSGIDSTNSNNNN